MDSKIISYKLLLGLTTSDKVRDDEKFEIPEENMELENIATFMATSLFSDDYSANQDETLIPDAILYHLEKFDNGDNVFSNDEMQEFYKNFGADLDRDGKVDEFSKNTFIKALMPDDFDNDMLIESLESFPLLESAYKSYFDDVNVSDYDFSLSKDGVITANSKNSKVKISSNGDVALNGILYSQTTQKKGKTSTQLTQCGQIFEKYPDLKTTNWFGNATITGESLGVNGVQGTLIAFAKDGSIESATGVNSNVIQLLCKDCGFDKTKLSNVLKTGTAYNLEKSGSSYIIKQGDKQIYPIKSEDFKKDYSNNTVYKELYPNSTSVPEKHTVLDTQKMAEIKAQKFVQELGTRAGNSINALTLEDLLGRETHYNKAWATQGSIDLGELIWGADNEIIKDMRKTPGNHVNYLIGMEQFQLLEDNNKKCLSALKKKGVDTKDVQYTTPKLGDIVITSNADGTNWHSGWVSSIDYSKNPPTYTVIESNSAVSKDGHGVTTRTYTIGDDSEKSIRGFISFSKNEEVAKAYETIEKTPTTPEKKQKIKINFENFQKMISDSSKELKFDANNGTYVTNDNILSFETTAQDGTLLNIFFDFTTGEIQKTSKKDDKEEKTKVDIDGKETHYVNNQQVQELNPQKTKVDEFFEDVIKLKDSEIADMMEKLYPDIINSDFEITQSSNGEDFELVADDGTILKITNYHIDSNGKISFDFTSYPKDETEPEYEAKVEKDEVTQQAVAGFALSKEPIEPQSGSTVNGVHLDSFGRIDSTNLCSNIDEFFELCEAFGMQEYIDEINKIRSRNEVTGLCFREGKLGYIPNRSPWLLYI